MDNKMKSLLFGILSVLSILGIVEYLKFDGEAWYIAFFLLFPSMWFVWVFLIVMDFYEALIAISLNNPKEENQIVYISDPKAEADMRARIQRALDDKDKLGGKRG